MQITWETTQKRLPGRLVKECGRQDKTGGKPSPGGISVQSPSEGRSPGRALGLSDPSKPPPSEARAPNFGTSVPISVWMRATRLGCNSQVLPVLCRVWRNGSSSPRAVLQDSCGYRAPQRGSTERQVWWGAGTERMKRDPGALGTPLTLCARAVFPFLSVCLLFLCLTSFIFNCIFRL